MLAIFGGSFDPVHLGHINLAQQVQQTFSFDEFIFLPCGEPPHKNKFLFSQQQRLKMLQLSMPNDLNVKISTFEFNGKISYTIDALKHFYHNKKKICFIMGSDSFVDLKNWDNYEEFHTLTNILVINRGNIINNFCGFETTTNIDDFKTSVGKIYFFTNQLMAISSTKIRSKIHNLENINNFVPKNIINFINEYRKNTTN